MHRERTENLESVFTGNLKLKLPIYFTIPDAPPCPPKRNSVFCNYTQACRGNGGSIKEADLKASDFFPHFFFWRDEGREAI